MASVEVSIEGKFDIDGDNHSYVYAGSENSSSLHMKLLVDLVEKAKNDTNSYLTKKIEERGGADPKHKQSKQKASMEEDEEAGTKHNAEPMPESEQPPLKKERHQ